MTPKTVLCLAAVVTVAGCGSSKATSPPPPPTVTGTVSFMLDQVRCQGYATAEYVVDSISVGTEQIILGSPSKSYAVPAGRRSTIARVLKAGATSGLWTFRNTVSVPENGGVSSNLVC